MNYYQARQRQGDQRWDWTVRNDDRFYRVDACAEHDDGHATREEAERHQWEWATSELTESTLIGVQHPCAVCQAWTDRAASTRDGHGSHISLCDEHRNVEGLRQAYPFRPGVAITSSW